MKSNRSRIDEELMGAERNKRRLSTAYHEAGHAVMAWHVGARINNLSIIPSNDAYGYMHATYQLGPIKTYLEVSPAQRSFIEKRAMIGFSGRHAQIKFNPRGFRKYHAEDDLIQAGKYLSVIETNFDLLSIYTEWIDGRAKAAITGSSLWPYVECLAESLYRSGKLKRPEIKEILYGCTQQLSKKLSV